MARSSYGQRRATTWTVTQKPRPMPRVVRLGRAANDNSRRPGMPTRLLAVGAAMAVLVLALVDWRVI